MIEGGRDANKRDSVPLVRIPTTLNHVLFVLLHSPLAGPLTWSAVGRELAARGFAAFTPQLRDDPAYAEPFWQQHARSVAEALPDSSAPLILVAHSGAGPLMPAVRAALPNPVNGYLFVDAGLPEDGRSRLELMAQEDADFAAQLRAHLAQGHRFPDWTADDLAPILPDAALREALVADLQPRALPYFEEPIPVPANWPDAPCGYLLFSDPYRKHYARAQQLGWPAVERPGGHFDMLVDAEGVADVMIRLVEKFS